MAKKKEIPFEFEIINPVECELIIPIKIKNRTLRWAFKKQLQIKKEEIDPDMYDEITEFKAPNHIKNLIRTTLKPTVNDVLEQVEKDGIKVNYIDIKQAIYKKVGEEWIVVIQFLGTYKDLRADA